MEESTKEPIRLTQYSRGAGCGCKIAPRMLEEILRSDTVYANSPSLLVGNQANDDAAVYDLGNGTAVISTTDFFMPIVDDAFDFGRIASANAISDVYAMGESPDGRGGAWMADRYIACRPGKARTGRSKNGFARKRPYLLPAAIALIRRNRCLALP